MPFISSPLAFPSTSSLRHESPRKRRKLDEARPALLDVPPNTGRQTVGGFVLDEPDEEETLDLPGYDATSARSGYHPKDRQEFPAIDDVDGDRTTSDDAAEKRYDSGYSMDNCDETEMSLTPSASRPRSSLSSIQATSCSGRAHQLRRRRKQDSKTYEEIVGERSHTGVGRAHKSYYGIEIQTLIESAKAEIVTKAAADPVDESQHAISLPNTCANQTAVKKTQLWTEKYRARKFTDLVGDERTHRSVLRWLKAWDPIVFPGAAKPKKKPRHQDDPVEERVHRKILLLTGPPGLGKTTLAHVCAKQAGYEVQEINASDERSRDVVKGRIRDMVGTENVRQVDRGINGKTKKVSRPVCVVVDEVDGVVSGNSGSGGEGGFIKALADLLALDQKNSSGVARAANADNKRRKKGDNFRLLRPVILICNDVYHPALRLLRQGTMAEIVYVRKPPLNMLVPRMQSIFEKEGVPCDSDGVRHLCEAAWGVSNRKEDKAAGGASEGDVRGVLVVAEWVASKIKTASLGAPEQCRLTKRWVEDNMLKDLSHGGGGARSLGRGGSKEIVERVFAHNAGFPAGHVAQDKQQRCSTVTLTATETAKQRNVDRLRELIESSGEDDRIMSDCFTTYLTLPYQDDTYLTKPTTSYEWLHFHDLLSSRIYSNQDWELSPYLSTSILAFHDLFASTSRHSYNTNTLNNTDPDAEAELKPYTGPRASHAAHEATKANHAALQHLHSQLSVPLTRAFRGPAHLSAELLPYLLRILTPDIKPVIVGGSEKAIASVRRGAEKEMVRRSVDAMIACGITFERARVDGGDGAMAGGGFVFRMEPGLDALGVFETMEGVAVGRVRYAVRQVLEQEFRREVLKREGEAGMRRMRGGDGGVGDAVVEPVVTEEAAKVPKSTIKRDFFGRPVVQTDCAGTSISDENGTGRRKSSHAGGGSDEGRVWVTYHEGFSNAVRKGITLKELLEGL